MKKSNRYSSNYGKEVWKELEHVIAFGYSNYSVFYDWIEFIMSALLSLTDNLQRKDGKQSLVDFCTKGFNGKYEDRYMKIVKKYKQNKEREIGKRPIDYFTTAWAKLQLETAEIKEDVIGHIFEDRISHGNNGQFFTPFHLSDLMAELVGSKKKEKL